MALRPLNDRQRRFVNAWVSSGMTNATAAAREAGYKGTDGSVRMTASRLLTRDNVQAAIAAMTGKAIQRADRGAVASLQECLEFETRVMRSRLGDFIGDDGEPMVQKIKEAPEGLVKKLRIKSTTDEKGQVYAQHEIELESAQEAARTLIKHHEDADSGQKVAGLFAEVLRQQPPRVVAAIARAMLAGHRQKAIDVTSKVVE
jgi:phage terminase small subunit